MSPFAQCQLSHLGHRYKKICGELPMCASMRSTVVCSLRPSHAAGSNIVSTARESPRGASIQKSPYVYRCWSRNAPAIAASSMYSKSRREACLSISPERLQILMVAVCTLYPTRCLSSQNPLPCVQALDCRTLNWQRRSRQYSVIQWTRCEPARTLPVTPRYCSTSQQTAYDPFISHSPPRNGRQDPKDGLVCG